MIMWNGYEVAPRKLRLVPRQSVRYCVPCSRCDGRGVTRVRVAVDEIILAVLAAFGAISLVALTTWLALKLVFG